MENKNNTNGLIKTNNDLIGKKRQDNSIQNRLGIGEYAIGKHPLQLSTYGLGSCVAVTIYDNESKSGGLVHIMLPHTDKDNPENPYKYATYAIPKLIEEISVVSNKEPHELTAKIVGGSKMFEYIEFGRNIGQRNIDESKRILENYNVNIESENTGGNHGRRVLFDLQNGEVEVNSSYNNGKSITL